MQQQSMALTQFYVITSFSQQLLRSCSPVPNRKYAKYGLYIHLGIPNRVDTGLWKRQFKTKSDHLYRSSLELLHNEMFRAMTEFY